MLAERFVNLLITCTRPFRDCLWILTFRCVYDTELVVDRSYKLVIICTLTNTANVHEIESFDGFTKYCYKYCTFRIVYIHTCVCLLCTILRV